MTTNENNIQSRRMGGLLILIAIGVFYTPLKLAYHIIKEYPPIFTDGIWAAISSKESVDYSVIFQYLIIGEIIGNIIIIILSLYLIFLFVYKKSFFPIWYVAVALTSCLFVVLDSYVYSLAVPASSIFSYDIIRELGHSLIALLLFSPYLFISKRSRETFVF